MSRETRLRIVLGLNLALIAGLVVVGLTAHSLGVLAAGGDYLADATAIGVSLFAIALSRRPPTPRRPSGYPRATAIAALTNGLFLSVVVIVVTAEAVRRLIDGGGRVDGLPVVIASGIAAIVMLIGAAILGGDADDDADTEATRRTCAPSFSTRSRMPRQRPESRSAAASSSRPAARIGWTPLSH